MSTSKHKSDLDAVQRWFHAVITHPDGVLPGVESEAAQSQFALGRDELEQMVTRSSSRTAAQRLHVYANAYYARLIECLGESYPALKRTLGDDTFNGFAFGYLQAFPPRSYTLNVMGERFAEYLHQTRPDRREDGNDPLIDWPDLLIDLARLEWTINEVFDAPGSERQPQLTAEALAAIAPDDWPRARLATNPCLRLLVTSYPVNDYYTAVRRAGEDDDVAKPDARPSWVAISRRDYVVRRHNLSRAQYELLAALQRGLTVGDAIALAADAEPGVTIDALAASLREWFSQWSAAGLFLSISHQA